MDFITDIKTLAKATKPSLVEPFRVLSRYFIAKQMKFNYLLKHMISNSVTLELYTFDAISVEMYLIR